MSFAFAPWAKPMTFNTWSQRPVRRSRASTFAGDSPQLFDDAASHDWLPLFGIRVCRNYFAPTHILGVAKKPNYSRSLFLAVVFM